MTQISQIPPAVTALVSLWKRFIEAVEAYNATIDVLQKDEIEAFNLQGETYMCAISDREAKAETKEVVESMIRRLLRIAESEFAPAGARLEIPEHKIAHECAALREQTFNPVTAWEFLAKKYGGGAGAMKAYSDRAILIKKTFNEFWARNAGTIKTVGGRMVLTVSIYGDGIGKAYSHQSIDSIMAGVNALSGTMEWSGMGGAPRFLKDQIRNQIEGRDKSYGDMSIPDRMNLTEHVLLVPYKSKMEFRLSPELGEQLRIFLAEYAPAEDAAA